VETADDYCSIIFIAQLLFQIFDEITPMMLVVFPSFKQLHSRSCWGPKKGMEKVGLF